MRQGRYATSCVKRDLLRVAKCTLMQVTTEKRTTKPAKRMQERASGLRCGLESGVAVGTRVAVRADADIREKIEGRARMMDSARDVVGRGH